MSRGFYFRGETFSLIRTTLLIFLGCSASLSSVTSAVLNDKLHNCLGFQHYLFLEPNLLFSIVYKKATESESLHSKKSLITAII